jgi:exodeoxyribonuclease VII small subunit
MIFEEAYDRLEKILERISSDSIPLEEALTLYEEADRLIQACQNQLTTAEQKIEILLKNREGNLSLDKMGQPETEPFIPSRHSAL